MYSGCMDMLESSQITTREENYSPRDLISPNSNSVLKICDDTNPVITPIWSLKTAAMLLPPNQINIIRNVGLLNTTKCHIFNGKSIPRNFL